MLEYFAEKIGESSTAEILKEVAEEGFGSRLSRISLADGRVSLNADPEIAELSVFEVGNEERRLRTIEFIQRVLDGYIKDIKDRALFVTDDGGVFLLHKHLVASVFDQDGNITDLVKEKIPSLAFRNIVGGDVNNENLAHVAKIFYMKHGRLPVLGSLGCKDAVVERSLLQEGRVEKVIGVDVGVLDAEFSENEGDFTKIQVSTEYRDLDQLRKDVFSHLQGVDILYLGDSLHHTNNVYQYVHEAFDCLNKGGHLFVSEPFYVEEDTVTPNKLFIEDDSTEYHESMFSLDQHYEWIRWLILNGARLNVSTVLPGYLAGDRDSYNRSRLPGLFSTDNYNKKLQELTERGMFTQLEDGFNRVRLWLEKVDHVEGLPFEFEDDPRLDLGIPFSALNMSIYEVWPLSLLSQEQQKVVRDQFCKSEDMANYLIPRSAAKDIRKLIFLLLMPESSRKNIFNGNETYEEYCAKFDALTSMVIPGSSLTFQLKDKDDDERKRISKAGVIMLIGVYLKELGIDVQEEIHHELNHFLFQEVDPERIFDPHKILAKDPVGVDTHYSYPEIHGEKVFDYFVNVCSSNLVGVTMPEDAVGVEEVNDIMDVFEIWPLSLVREEDRERVVDKIMENGGERNLSGKFQSDVVGILGRRVREWVIRKINDFDDETYKKYLFYYLIDREEIVEYYKEHGEHREGADCYFCVAEATLLVAALDNVCKLGYLIEEVVKTPTWEPSIMQFFPDVFKKL